MRFEPRHTYLFQRETRSLISFNRKRVKLGITHMKLSFIPTTLVTGFLNTNSQSKKVIIILSPIEMHEWKRCRGTRNITVYPSTEKAPLSREPSI